ncbi:MAG: ImmA/IrrE family metallo-endopeptidase [Rhodobacteraceae bacterium]|nr:MAG: ImmA/IrrE family metallo-endopeptidase [Paracoccaceae bacterium]
MYSLRDVFAKGRFNGEQRDLLRRFNMVPKGLCKASSVKQLAEQLGFSVDQVDLPFGMSGRLVSDAFSQNGYAIEVNRKQSVEARRWAVLHEMGHYFLHVDHLDPFQETMHLDRSGEVFYVEQIKEKEANQFAEVLLFGDGALAAARSLFRNDNEALRRVFGVSVKTLDIAMRRF